MSPLLGVALSFPSDSLDQLKKTSVCSGSACSPALMDKNSLVLCYLKKLTRDNDSRPCIDDTTVWPYTVPAWCRCLHFETHSSVRGVFQFEVGGNYICERTWWTGNDKQRRKTLFMDILGICVAFIPCCNGHSTTSQLQDKMESKSNKTFYRHISLITTKQRSHPESKIHVVFIIINHIKDVVLSKHRFCSTTEVRPKQN